MYLVLALITLVVRAFYLLYSINLRKKNDRKSKHLNKIIQAKNFHPSLGYVILMSKRWRLTTDNHSFVLAASYHESQNLCLLSGNKTFFPNLVLTLFVQSSIKRPLLMNESTYILFVIG